MKRVRDMCRIHTLLDDFLDDTSLSGHGTLSGPIRNKLASSDKCICL